MGLMINLFAKAWLLALQTLAEYNLAHLSLVVPFFVLLLIG